MKPAINLFFTFLPLIFGSLSFAQTIPVGTPFLEEAWRRMQIKGDKGINTSFTVRPIYTNILLDSNSVNFLSGISSKAKTNGNFSFAKGKGSIRLLPVTIKQQYNADHPYGWNDGTMIQARGYQNQLSLGVYSKLGPLSIQLQPEFVYAQNKDFSTFPITHQDSIWKSYYSILNRIDDPEKYGSGHYAKFFPGQSSIRLNFKRLSLGVSTENLWWGPGIRNSLVMSNHAPGFTHGTFNTTAPVTSPIGSFEWQVIAGIVKSSGILPPDTARTFNGQKLYLPKIVDDRYLNGIIVTWQPKWTKGLHLGFTRVFYQYKSVVSSSLNGYLPVFSAFFYKNSPDENAFGRDQLLSLFFRLVLPESKTEFYAEFGRNDHSGNSRDLLLEPEHARAYIIGGRKIFEEKKQKEIELFIELTQLQNPATIRLRALEGWYTHYQVRHGYTNLGQVIGAGIGPGGSSQTVGINWINGTNKFGTVFERVVRNNDFYYDAFEPTRNFGRHWVDLSLNFDRSWQIKRFIYTANLSLVRSFNYQWRYDSEIHKYIDVNNLHANFSISYLF